MEIKKSYEVMGIVIGLISLIVASIGVVTQIRSEKTRELTSTIDQTTELTSVSEVPGLSAEFKYKDKKVIHLWKILLDCVNTGSDTLIGEGQHNNLLNDGILFKFPAETEILNYDLVYTNLPLKIQQDEPGAFKLKFSQWRSGERALLTLYIASQKAQPSPLLPYVDTRDIVDGKVVVRNGMNSVGAKRMAAMDRLPVGISVSIRLILTLVCGLLAWLGIYMVPVEWGRLIRLHGWSKRNNDAFVKYVDQLAGVAENMKTYYKSNPNELPTEKWQQFQGEKLRLKNGSLLFKPFSISALALGVALFAIGIVSLAYVGTNTVDLYALVRTYL